MNRCSGCGYFVPGTWTECRRCGTPVSAEPAFKPVALPASRGATRNGLAIAPPPAPSSFGSPDDALLPGARPRGPVPDTMLPRVDPLLAPVSAPTRSRFNNKTITIGAIVVVIVAGAYSVIPRGGHAKQAPTILAPRPPAAGIPTSLSDVVRIAAESTRHTALTAAIELAGTTGAPLTLSQLQSAEPNYEWVIGSEPSTTNTVVSITSGTGIDVIAVSGTDHDICAFGRWSSSIAAEYVTMAHVKDCAATNAPLTGWSSQRGGSAQDLPGADGL